MISRVRYGKNVDLKQNITILKFHIPLTFSVMIFEKQIV